MKKSRILVDLFEYIDDIESSQAHTLAGFYKDNEGNDRIVNVLDNEMFKTYFENFFYSYSMISVKQMTAPEVAIAFNNMWRIFQIEQKENINKLVQGYFWDYNPIYNYDRTERWKDVKTGNETDKRELNYAKKTITDTPTGSYKDTTQNGATSRTDSVATMDDNSFHNTDKSEVAAVTNTNERTYNEYKDTHEEAAHVDKDDNTHSYNEVTDAHDGYMAGNIGTTTTWDMLSQEFENRVHMLGYEFLKRFFDKFFVML